MIQAIFNRKLPVFLLLFLSLSIYSNVSAQDAKSGKSVFRSKCGSCHDVSLQKDMTGPALMGVIDRWKSAGDFKGKSGEEWLKTWILNYNDAVGAGYPYANKMVNWAPSAMNVFAGQITDKELGDVMAYIADPSAGGGAKAVAADATTAGTPKSASNGPILMLVILALLLVVAFALGTTSNNLSEIIAEKNGQPVPAKVPFYLSRKFKTSLLIFAILFLCYAICKDAIQLGRSQGYQPAQPIKFSHALHAGKNKIECQYCHSSADKGKHSNIPSANVCMNCHKNVQVGPQYGEREIAKIYDAVGWDVKTQTYSKPQKPIEWVRVHNLPDHVYFNHAQHVNAGKVKCQTCHGPVEEMDEVYQYAPLSMGWCVNCHRNHDVQFSDNSYYKTYVKYHEEMKAGKRKRVTVNDIGGTECQKCHY
ncbi:MAG: c-type cytochrome [Bacteroidetes bacterium]|nr:c-type cytochrome [Bacteroidota bacterium]